MKFKPNGSWVVMVDPRTEAVKCRVDNQDMLLVGEHQLLGKW